ncbi:hypothetical protein FGIG_01153 [Fasciola gigantica]|uniref:Uncharacterized protein n=1 Tax=Fasciola gigantica TaxID=46835 RepID=A0A504YWE2_FASGI|nr:hypothetical protein FGIG_01153 [Fasciola gigantica]
MLSSYSAITMKIFAALSLCLLLSSSDRVWANECIQYCYNRLTTCDEYCIDGNKGGTCKMKCQIEYDKCAANRCGII